MTHPNFRDVQMWKKKKNANNNFQTLLNENYILISAMLKWEEEQNVTNW